MAPQLCQSCQQANRTVAKYCKSCGKKLASPQGLDWDELVGLVEVKKEIQKILSIYQTQKQHLGTPQLGQLHMVLVGNTGTGKNEIVQLLNHHYHKIGLTTRDQITYVDASGFSEFSRDIKKSYLAAKGGILFIDNTQKLVPAGYTGGQITLLDKLFSQLAENPLDPILIMAALPGGFMEYLEENHDISNRFRHTFLLPDLTAPELWQLTQQKLQKQRFQFDTLAEEKLQKLYHQLVRTKDFSFGNGHLVRQKIEEITESYWLRVMQGNTADGIIRIADIEGDLVAERSLSDILAELNDLIGMQSIKSLVHSLVDIVQAQKRLKAQGIQQPNVGGLHLVITGNPGTGKTTVARLLGDIFFALGYLQKGHVVEVDREALVAGYIGQTASKTDTKIAEAMGGVLFIDEAYSLVKNNSGGDFGQEAIDTLLKRMEDQRGEFVCIAAGYPNEMNTFLEANPGLKSRFNHQVHIEDYEADELLAIFHLFVKKAQCQLTPEAEQAVQQYLQKLCREKDKNFGNGREVRKLFESVNALRSKRISQAGTMSLDELKQIQSADIPTLGEEEPTITLEEALHDLNELIGLGTVKAEINDLIQFLEVERQRSQLGGKKTKLGLHFVFKGNPGTGKTTVARILGKVFQALGLLSGGKVIETDREGLVASYVGQTAAKTNQVIDSAKGNVLFLDEAYTLAKGGNDFGQEAIDTLLKRMEDERGQFIVIAAGYHREMDYFLETNSGLRSRFSRHIHFEDYRPAELTAIFQLLTNKKGMHLAEGVPEAVLSLFTQLYANRTKSFANGRTVRNYFENQVLRQQAKRLASVPTELKDASLMNTLTLADIVPLDANGS